MSSLDFIYKRHSVRKFKNQSVPKEDIDEIIKAATYAPSGKNKQNWHFVVIRNANLIEQISDTIKDKANTLASKLDDEEAKNNFLKFIPYFTFFTNAPVLILVYAGPYPSSGYDILESTNHKEDASRVLNASPRIQNIGAAIENLLLAAANKGYGTCWMTGPNFASSDIEKIVNFSKEGYYLTAMTPLGVPEEKELNSPKRKPLEEVMTIID